jgi:hypothetical protein
LPAFGSLPSCHFAALQFSSLHLVHFGLYVLLGGWTVFPCRSAVVIDIAIERYAETVGVNVLRRSGDVEFVSFK